MAQRKKVVSAADGPTVSKVRKPEPLGRTGSPEQLRHRPHCREFRLEPKSKIHTPINVWGYPTETGWTGWIVENKSRQLKPSSWPRDMWNELPAAPKTEKKTG